MLFVLLLLSSVRTSDAKEADPGACATLPLLDRYDQAGLLSRSGDGELQLYLVADLHSADCGAPDCYGTNIVVRIRPIADRSRCFVKTAIIQTQDFVEPNCGFSDPVASSVMESYVVLEADADWGNGNLERVTLQNRSGTRALIIMRRNFFYFENVTAHGVLHMELPAEDENGCCWGATSSESHFPPANKGMLFPTPE